MLAGPFVVVAALLALGGLLKARRPAATARALRDAGLGSLAPAARAMGVVEVAVGAGALAFGGRPLAVLVAAAYAGFAAFVALALARRAPVADCGCFGSASSPPSRAHLAFDLVATAVAVAWATGAAPGLASIVGDQPLAGVPFLALATVGTGLAYAVLTVLPRALAEAASG